MRKRIISYLSPALALNASRFDFSIRLNSFVISTKRAAANWSQSFDFKSPWILETNAETASLDLSNDAVGTNCIVCRTGVRIPPNYKREKYIEILFKQYYALASTLIAPLACNVNSCVMEICFEDISSSSLSLKSTSSNSSELLSSPWPWSLSSALFCPGFFDGFRSSSVSISMVLHLTVWTFLSRISVWHT